MDFLSKFDKQQKEHGLAHVLFVYQVAWISTLGISKKEYFIKIGLIILFSPLFFFLGYGEIAEKLKEVGMQNYDNLITNFLAANFVFLHYAGKIFPYMLALNMIVFISTKMWTKQFWSKVEELKELNKKPR